MDYRRAFAARPSKKAHGRRRLRNGWSRTRGVVAILASLLVLASSLAPTLAAEAAGPAVVAVTVSITDPTGAVVSEVDASSMANYSVNVAYSCSIADCTGVQVVIDPTVLDPIYGQYRKETAVTFTPPFSPAPSFTGSLGAGYTVDLGTVAVGTGGSFKLAYRIDARYSGPQPGSFFLDGSPITARATVSASNADSSAVGTASANWVSSIPAAPTARLSAPASIRTDTPVTITAEGDSRCLSYNGAGVLLGIPWLTCAKDYTAPVTLPADAQYVAGSGGSYNAGTRTVTFSQTGAAAAGGLAFNDNTFQIVFPSDAFPTSGDGCVASEVFSVTETMTYLDGTVRTADPASTAIKVQNCTPFAKGALSKAIGGRDGGTPTDAIVDIPLTPGGVNNKYWQVEADNQANVAGVATITDADLGQDDMPITSIRIVGGGPATVNYTLDDATTGSATVAQGATWTPPSGHTIAGVSATSSLLVGPNSVESGTAVTRFIIRLNFSVHDGTTPGPRTNTATASIAYPDQPELGTLDLGSTTATATLQVNADVTLNAGGPSVTATGTPIVGGTVGWKMSGAMDNVAAGANYRPQYVFLAPKDWNITAGSAAVSGVPGMTYDYKTVTYNGESYDAVLATWPAAVTDVGKFNLPTMTVDTVPTGAATAGTNNQTAYLFLGDVNNGPVALYYPNAYTDASDFDGDGNATEQYSWRSNTTSLAPSKSIAVTKQICHPDAEQADGCDWISDSNITVGVPPNATAIKYRVTLANSGNVDLNNVVAYDVLPYKNDTGLTDGTASTPRGSTVQEVLATVSDVSAGVDLSYSGSTNPARPQVYTGTTDADDWGTTVTEAKAIRAQVTSLAAGASVTFDYEASLVDGTANLVACNSIAATAATLAPIEPAAVCASTQAADLEITAPAHLPMQQGRPGAADFTVINHGGSPLSPATVTAVIPAGFSVTDLAPIGYACSDAAGDSAPIAGPVTLSCVTQKPDGTVRNLSLDAPDTLSIPVLVDEDATGPSCIDASVTGTLYDPDLTNNDTSFCAAVADSTLPLITLDKTDNTTSVTVGEQTTYSLTVASHLSSEAVAGAVLTDTLPAGETFVSASDGGTASGQTVTWNLAELNPTGAPSADGSDTTGGSGAAITVTVTVQIDDGTQDTLFNTASVSAPDPAGGPTLTDGATDTDTVRNVFTDLDPAIATPQNQSINTPLSDIVTTTGASLDPASVAQNTAPTHGSITIDTTTGAVTYIPAPGYSGADSYEVTVCDTSSPAQCHVSTVTVAVGVNVVDAVNDTDATTAVTPVTTDVTGNDTTQSGQPLAHPTVPTSPTHGSAVVNGDGTITYTPAAAWSGTDSYGYQLCDTSTPTPVCDTATVQVTVANVFLDATPSIPTAQNAPVTTPLADIVTTTGLLLDPTQVTQETAPAHGSIAIDPHSGAVTYTPTAGYTGDDSYAIQVCDTDGVCHNSPVSVSVGANVVVVQDATISTRVNTDADPVDVLTTATSASGQPLGNPTITDQPAHGTVAVNADGTIAYVAGTDYVGSDSFTYTVCDTGSPTQACDTATITVTVVAIADLASTKTLDTAAVVPGLPVSYTAMLHNSGPWTATNVHSIDPIDKRVMHAKGTPDASVPGGLCLTRPTTTADLARLNPASGPYTIDDYPQVVDCSYPSIPSGTTVHDTITGTVDPAALPGGTILNQAPVYADSYDPDLSNNVGTATATITAPVVVDPTTPAGVDPTTSAPGGLATTGVDVARAGILALLLMLAGAGTLFLARRRRRA